MNDFYFFMFVFLSPLVFWGCATHAVISGDRIARKSHYSIDLPTDDWHGLMRENSYGGHGFAYYADEQAVFLHCPNHQGMTLTDIYMPNPVSISIRKQHSPPKADPDSFEGFAFYYLETKFFFTSTASSSSHHSLLSFSTKTISGNTVVDAAYKTETIAMPSCEAKNSIPITYIERFVVVSLPQRLRWDHPKMVVLSYQSPEKAYEEHLSDFEQWLSTLKIQQ